MQIKFQRLHPEAVLPQKAHSTDAAFDLTITEVLEDNDYIVWCSFGIAVEIPEGYFGLILPRSSNFRTGNILSNSAGVIDSGYRGELRACFYRFLDGTHIFHQGLRVAQLLILPIPSFEPEWAEELSASDRGEGGFGSTGA